MPVSLSIDEIHGYMDSRPGWIILTTIGQDGMPHSVPIGYFRLGDDVYIGCRDNTQKIRNIERNPNITVMLQSGGSMQDIKGVMIQGTATVVREPGEFLRLAREAARWRGMPEAQWPTEARPGAAYIRVRPRKYISWDYSRSE
ncbi:MAG TPA: pyridoxamine 5'-phosphate oxidase family protein [Dehalococcoidia bacterium]|nr:pyridoxamine 5'-phosphate oxidase family protein [Dehalococcoidia bacterium]